MIEQSLAICLLILFLIGGIGVASVNIKQKNGQKKAWTKYIVYFIIINLLFVSMMFLPNLFSGICLLIVLGGYIELIRLQTRPFKITVVSFTVIMLLFTLICLAFIYFSFSNRYVLLFTLLMVCSFDAFSQLSGQLFGKRKLCPQISPNKTVGGLIGGVFLSVILSVIVGNILDWPVFHSFALGIGIIAFAFMGDLSASYVKRLYKVKDFSRLLPGHGGILDRFDSLLWAGAFVEMIQIITA
jgi:phosphatidate cytidylyltransferase